MQQSRTLGVADKVNGLFGQTPASLFGNLLGALVLGAVMRGTVAPSELLGFASAFGTVWLLRAWVTWRFFRSDEPNRTPALSRRWLAWWNAGTLASGLIWGAAAWVFYPPADAVARTLLILTVYSFCVGSIPVLATQPRVFLAFTLCCFAPMTLSIALNGGPGGEKVAGVLVLVFAVTAALGHRFNRVFEKLVWLKARAEQLREELAAEKAAVQAAMAQLGRDQQPDFAAPREQVVEIGPLWRELQQDHEHEAADRHVTLSFRGHGQRAIGDAAQLSHLVRELLDCALQATTEGGIVVAARPLGPELRLQVWDTASHGPGAAGQARLEAVALRAKVLGLGWCARRVAGRGALHELRVPRAPSDAPPADGGSRPGRRDRLRDTAIAIVDEDPASRRALQAAFGARSDKVQACSASQALADAGADEAPLHLGVIGIGRGDEQRLPALLSAVRARGGDRLPVLVVADDATPALRAQALAARFHVVTRPLKSAALWPLVHFKLGLPRPDRDPTFTWRLARDSAHWSRMTGTPALGEAHLRRIAARGHHFMPASRAARAHQLGTRPSRQHVVLVHGGLSSVRAAMADALGGTLPLLHAASTWRFEHDAFLPVAVNAQQLAGQVVRTLCNGADDERRVVFVAHSRGGIVARLAAAQLQREQPGLRLQVCTFGTPHGGTGVFRRIGERWHHIGTALERMRKAVDGVAAQHLVAQLDLVARAFDHDIPPGFRDVEPDRIAPLLASAADFSAYTAWCSRWVPGRAHAPGLDLLSQLVEGVSGFEPEGDGLVSAASAAHGATRCHDASPLFHTGYFAHRPAMARLHLELTAFLRGWAEEAFGPALAYKDCTHGLRTSTVLSP